jgi:hypothetical protein
MNCPNCKAHNASNEPECHNCEFSFTFQETTPKIIVTKSGLTLDGVPLQVKNRWAAKRVAKHLSKHYGCNYWNLKESGELFEVGASKMNKSTK